MQPKQPLPLVAIACGGTGGHLFPGLAVADELLRRNCDVMLLISPKEVDQKAVREAMGMTVETLPAVGLTGKNIFQFSKGCWDSYHTAKQLFAKRPPKIVLAMGGFTSAPPIFAGKKFGAKTFLHESNTIPGRANRWLARFVDAGFVYFRETSTRLSLREVDVIGMPVRPQFLEPVDVSGARMMLGLDVKKPVVLVMGGSQGASGVNNLVINALPLLLQQIPDVQFLHLTGANDFEKVQKAYASQKCKAVVKSFFTEMEFALGAATVVISRSGASSLAELAAVRLPSILIPYPIAADNHQFHNANAFVETGCARMLEQSKATSEALVRDIVDLVKNQSARDSIQKNLARWHMPDAAEKIAERMLASIATPDSAAKKETARSKFSLPGDEGRCDLRKEANV